jgi:hypothetical protein
MSTKTTDVCNPQPHADIGAAARSSMKVGLATCGLLAVFDAAGLTGLNLEDAPSAAGGDDESSGGAE